MEEYQEQYQRMTQKSVAGLVLSLAIPTIVSMLVTSVYNMSDTYFVARTGSSATAAIGVVVSIMAMIQAVGFTLGMGSATKVSILLGKEETQQANTYATTALMMAVILGMVILVTGLYYLPVILSGLGATASMLPYATIYGRYILIAAPLSCVAFVTNNLLRAEGKAKYAMAAVVISTICHVLTDWILISVCSMSVAGAGIATIVSESVSCILLLYWYFSGKTVIRLHWKFISRKNGIYGEIVAKGFPSFVRQGLVSVATALTNLIAAPYGDEAVAGISVMNRIFLLLFSVIVGFVQGYSPVAGYNYGAEKNRRVRKALVFSMAFGVVVMSMISVATFCYGELLVNLFCIQKGMSWKTAITALRYQSVLLPFILVGVVCNMTYQAMGKAVTATFLAACRQGIFFVPVIVVLPKIWGIQGILLAQPVADGVTFLCSIPFIIKIMRKTRH